MLQIQLSLCSKFSSYMCFKTHLPYEGKGEEDRERTVKRDLEADRIRVKAVR